jgi:predicted dehydrogenase
VIAAPAALFQARHFKGMGTDMAKDKIGVGIIGLSPGRSWAAGSIVPGIKALPEYNLVAASTTKMESANAVAKEFNIPHAFDNHQALVSHPDVDLRICMTSATAPT